MGNLISIVHPAHGIIGDILTVLLCIPVAALFLFTFLWPLYSFSRDWFGVVEDVPVMPEKSALSSLPLGAPRAGNVVYNGHGWTQMTDEEAREVQKALKILEGEKMRTPDEWKVLALETAPVAHPDRELEITNGPDDIPEEDEVEGPDERMVFVSE